MGATDYELTRGVDVELDVAFVEQRLNLRRMHAFVEHARNNNFFHVLLDLC